jgi:hypothetical protein
MRYSSYSFTTSALGGGEWSELRYISSPPRACVACSGTALTLVYNLAPSKSSRGDKCDFRSDKRLRSSDVR